MGLLKIMLTIFLCFSFVITKADVLSVGGAIEQNQTDYPDTLLYAISGPEIQDSYLFGTLHMMPQDKFYMPQKVANAVQAVDKLVLELDMDDPVELGQMMSLSLLPKGQHVYEFMTEEQWQKLQHSWQQIYGEGSQKYSRIKPFLLIAFLMKKYLGQAPASYEAALMQLAAQYAKPIAGLESVAQQMQMIDKIGLDKQVEMLMEFINEEEAMMNDFNDMVEMYLNEDVNAITELMRSYYDEDPQVLKAMLDERNENWISVIAAKAADESALFAFGVGHLGGDKGVLKLLVEAGYTVKPVGGTSDEQG